MSEPFIVHSHIPKTGGSALNRGLLFPMYGEDRVYPMYRQVFETASRLPRRHVARAMRCFVAIGHVPFGYFDEVYPDAIYVSIFRDPVARFISSLNVVLDSPDHLAPGPLNRGVLENAADDPDAMISAILAEPGLAIVLLNTQTRLAGGSPRLGEYPVTLDHLDAARRNIARRRYITGVQENMTALIDRVRQRFPQAIVRNSGPDYLVKRLPETLHVDALRPRTLDRLRAANDLDVRLYAALQEQPVDGFAEAA